MSISATVRDQRVANIWVKDSGLIVALKDGREIRAPLAWFPRLASASPEQRAKWETSAAGHGIHRPLIDEDLSVVGLLHGESAPV